MAALSRRDRSSGAAPLQAFGLASMKNEPEFAYRPRRSARGSAWQPRSQLGTDPGAETTRPDGFVVGVFFDDPATNLGGVQRQERASVHNAVGAVVLQPLDEELLVLPVEAPDLGDFESGIDSRPINLRGRHIDLDAEIGVGILSDVKGSQRLSGGHGVQLIGIEEIAFIGLQTARDIGP